MSVYLLCERKMKDVEQSKDRRHCHSLSYCSDTVMRERRHGTSKRPFCTGPLARRSSSTMTRSDLLLSINAYAYSGIHNQTCAPR